jgi:hypothetical protein
MRIGAKHIPKHDAAPQPGAAPKPPRSDSGIRFASE